MIKRLVRLCLLKKSALMLMILGLQVYRQALRQLMQQAMSHDDDKMLRSAHLQLSAMLENKLVDFSV